jgi:predicted peptidase
MQSHRFTATREVALDYWLSVPDALKDSTEPVPLVIFLHGAGERGGLEYVTSHGPARQIKEGKQFPFITLAPSCPAHDWWFTYIPMLNALLDDILARYPVDPRRVYLTGLSMGGNGTWHWAMQNPERFAAIAPICGFGVDILYPEGGVANLKDVPVWTFHGALDDVVALHETAQLVDALKTAGGQVRFTVYPDLKHNSWDAAYETPELYDWLLGHVRL